MLSPHRGRTTASRLKHLTAGKKFGKWQVAWVGYYSTDVSTPVPGYLKQSADVIDAARTGSASGTCVDHIVVLGEAHLRQTLREYARYYNTARTHRSLDQDAPVSRHV